MHSLLKKSALLWIFGSTVCLGGAVRPDAGSFAIGGEYLYWQPLYDQSYYAADTVSPNLVTTRFDNAFHWVSAYRIEGVYNFYCGTNDFSVRWTHLITNEHRTVEDPVLLPTQSLPANELTALIPGVAISDLQLRYYAVDVIFGQLIYNCAPFALSIGGGLQWAYVNFEEDISYTTGLTTRATETLTKKNRFSGVGPELALDLCYNLPTWRIGYSTIPMAICGSFNTALIVSESQTSLTDRFTAGTFFYDTNNDEKWRIIPMWDLRFGLGSEFLVCCYRVDMEVGYEVLSYSRSVQSIIYTDENSAGASFDSYDDLSFHGLYFSLDVTF